MRLLIFIFILIFAYYVISRYLFPYLVKTVLRKAQEKFGGQFGQQAQAHREPEKKEGEVSVKYVPPEAQKNKFNPETSEDVDFEEIKDN